MAARPATRAPGDARLLLLVDALWIGGSERKAVRVANYLQGRGYAIRVAYLNGPDDLRAELDPAIPVSCLERRGKFSPRTLRRVNRLVRDNGIDTLLCMNLYPALYGWLGAHRHARTLVFVNTRPDWFARTDRRLVYTPILRRVDRLAFGCRFQRDGWCDQFGLGGDNGVVVYNGVDTGHYDPAMHREAREPMRAQLGVGAGDVLACTVAGMRPVKRHIDLLRALLHTPGSRLHLALIGDGSERVALEEFVRSNGLSERVNFAGQHDDVRPWLAAADLFVLSSRWETFSNAALEAMCFGLPVVMPAVGGVPEMVSDGVEGLLFPPGDAVALAACLARLATDPALRGRLGAAGRQRVLSEFSLTDMMARYEALIAGTL